MNALLTAQGLTADDILFGDSRKLHRLIRELLLLGLGDEMEACRRSQITRLARSLMRRKRRMGNAIDYGAASAS